MTLSFRTRQFLTAALVVSLAIASVLVFGRASLLTLEVSRLDERLCMEARRLASPVTLREPWPRLQDDLLAKLHLDSRAQLMVRVDRRDNGPLFAAADPAAEMIFDTLDWKPVARPTAERMGPGDCSLASMPLASTHWRVARFTSPALKSYVAADLAATETDLYAVLERALLVLVPLALLLSGLAAWALSSLALRPINRMREAMKGMNPRALDQRLSSRGEDREFRELIEAYNTMLARLEASFEQASRFSADAAHELRIPLTILQGRIERALHDSNGRAVQTDLAEMLDEVGRLAAITRKLLLLSRADSGQLALQLRPVELSKMLDELVSDAQMLVTHQQITSHIERGLRVSADEVLLRQLLSNLISNATRYCRPGGRIEVTATGLGKRAQIRFTNTTLPIPAESRQRFFNRFYRGHAARNREIDGTGLGLTLAREIARAHGGELELEPSPDDEVRLCLWLPVNGPVASPAP